MTDGELMKYGMLRYLQSMMDDFKEWEKRAEGKAKDSVEHEWMMSKMHAMIACKEMVECLIGEPVNLQCDGKVTVGLY